ncbi:hypothetical protein EMCG_05558 [[Emmonsia] crescens]|uniref:Uncharacterized protein n=1 Tax=[Emmonsia] crescens TaxID=73230 RepID=A0A0G2HN71_9EURO|nr:hypothetical protein EMCG_05558 [Emmonsia crescens UAMH 3008]
MDVASANEEPNANESTIIVISEDGDLIIEVIEYDVVRTIGRVPVLGPKSAASFQWWDAKSKEILLDCLLWCEALYPCYYFHCAAGFRILTKELVYESMDYITTKTNPIHHHQTHLHLPARVIQKLNEKRGCLRNIIHDRLCSPIQNLAATRACQCREQIMSTYIKELTRIGASPLEPTFRHISIRKMLQHLEEFNKSNVPRKSDDNCHCSYNWSSELGTIVAETRSEADNRFIGLALDFDRKEEARHGRGWP